MSSSFTVAYLIWAPLGTAPAEKFLLSYQQHFAGLEHELLIIFNGFRSDNARQPFVALFDHVRIPWRPFVVSQVLQDIPAYKLAAEHVSSRWVCFLNSYAQLRDGDWLAKMAHCLQQPSVGVVSATGSFESHYTRLGYVPPPGEMQPRPKWWRLAGKLRRAYAQRRARPYYDPFPTAHVRTSAFAMERALFLDLKIRCSTKEQCHRFEGGRFSLTNQLRERGLNSIVVGRDGRCYLPHEWQQSGTFRFGEQENLLIGDNRTEQYMKADEIFRRRLRFFAWRCDPTAP